MLCTFVHAHEAKSTPGFSLLNVKAFAIIDRQETDLAVHGTERYFYPRRAAMLYDILKSFLGDPIKMRGHDFVVNANCRFANEAAPRAE